MAKHIRTINRLFTAPHQQFVYNAPLEFIPNSEEGGVFLTAAGRTLANDPQVLENFFRSLAENDLTENE